MSLVYLGTSAFAAAVLRTLAGSADRPSLVVTPPDRRQGRGRRIASPPAADAARELGIELHQARSVNDPEGYAPILDSEAELAVVCAFGQLIAEPLLTGLELLNVHPSLLPRWRGAAPIERAIMAGDERTGTAIMRLTEGLDSGPVALTAEIEIGPREDFGSLEPRLAALSAELLLEALELRRHGGLVFEPQAEGGVSYAEKIERSERRLDPVLAATELNLRTRALNPHVGTHLELEGGGRLGVRAATPWTGPAPPTGELAELDGRLVLGCGEGALELLRVRPVGGREMAGADLLRGRGLPRLSRCPH
ncbi:MAG: methionyl-tRNA formyltransferase [Solirubrobacterales bacterium]|nr:methionyl-tRNA formyltransferase [Solirubrobacterales bacterium]